MDTPDTTNGFSQCTEVACPFYGKNVNDMLGTLASTRRFSDRCARSDRAGGELTPVLEKLFAVGCMRLQAKQTSQSDSNFSSSAY